MKSIKQPGPKFWSVPRMWAGETVCILASGPSMSQAVADAVAETSWRKIVINETWKLLPSADMLFAADARWWNAEVKKFSGLKVSVMHNNDPSADDVFLLKNTGEAGFDPDPTAIRTGRNSGYQAVHIAAQAGATRIILTGFDMRSINRQHHWHDPHRHPLRDHGDGIYPMWIALFNTIAPILAGMGIEVINATPDSALTCFKRSSLGDIIAADLAAETPDSQARPNAGVVDTQARPGTDSDLIESTNEEGLIRERVAP